MPLDAFSPSATIVGTLTGGVTSVGRTLINQSGLAQSQAAKNIQRIFSSRIENAMAKLGASNSTASSEQLLRDQSRLISRKEQISESVGIISQSLNQINYIKNHIDYLQKQLTDLENNDITAAEVSVDWDNKLRKINQFALAASKLIKDGGNYYQKNLINSSSRSSFSTQTFFAPYNYMRDTLQVDGVYLGTDYFITEDSSGDFWNSDTGYLSLEDDVGTLREYSSYPDTATGQLDIVTNLALNSYDNSTGSIDFTLSDSTNITGIVSGGGLALLDAWIYSGFDNQTSIDQAKDALDAAEGLVLTTQAEFLNDRATLQSRASLYGVKIAGISSEISNLIEDIQDEARAEILASQLAFAIAQFNFSLLAARGNGLVKSILISQDGEDFGANTNAGRVLISVGQTMNVYA